jgi:hypothetical protein
MCDVVFQSSTTQTATDATKYGTVVNLSDAEAVLVRARATAKTGSGTPTLKLTFQSQIGGVWYDLPTAGTYPNKWSFPTFSNATGAKFLRMAGALPSVCRVKSKVAGGTAYGFTWRCEAEKVVVI